MPVESDSAEGKMSCELVRIESGNRKKEALKQYVFTHFHDTDKSLIA